LVSTETKTEHNIRAITYKVFNHTTVLQKIITKNKHNINLPLFVFTNRQKEEIKKIIVLNTTELKRKSIKEKN